MRNIQAELALIDSLDSRKVKEISNGNIKVAIVAKNGKAVEGYTVSTNWSTSSLTSYFSVVKGKIYYFTVLFKDKDLLAYSPAYEILKVMIIGKKYLWLWDYFKTLVFSEDTEGFVDRYYSSAVFDDCLKNLDVRVCSNNNGFRELQIFTKCTEETNIKPRLLFYICWWAHRGHNVYRVQTML